jgi:hypothetical protein
MVLLKGKDQELFVRKPTITWTHLRTLSISANPYTAQAYLQRLFQDAGRFPGGDADQPEEEKGGDHHKWSFAE